MKIAPEDQNFERHIGVLLRVSSGAPINPSHVRVCAKESAHAFENIREFLKLVADDGGNPLCEQARALLETSGLEGLYDA